MGPPRAATPRFERSAHSAHEAADRTRQESGLVGLRGRAPSPPRRRAAEDRGACCRADGPRAGAAGAVGRAACLQGVARSAATKQTQRAMRTRLVAKFSCPPESLIHSSNAGRHRKLVPRPSHHGREFGRHNRHGRYSKSADSSMTRSAHFAGMAVPALAALSPRSRGAVRQAVRVRAK